MVLGRSILSSRSTMQSNQAIKNRGGERLRSKEELRREVQLFNQCQPVIKERVNVPISKCLAVEETTARLNNLPGPRDCVSIIRVRLWV